MSRQEPMEHRRAAAARAQDDDWLRDLGHLPPPSHDPCLGRSGWCSSLQQLSRSGYRPYALRCTIAGRRAWTIYNSPAGSGPIVAELAAGGPRDASQDREVLAGEPSLPGPVLPDLAHGLEPHLVPDDMALPGPGAD